MIFFLILINNRYCYANEKTSLTIALILLIKRRFFIDFLILITNQHLHFLCPFGIFDCLNFNIFL